MTSTKDNFVISGSPTSFVVSVGPGVVIEATGTVREYTGGTVSVTASATNYIYLIPSSGTLSAATSIGASSGLLLGVVVSGAVGVTAIRQGLVDEENNNDHPGISVRVMGCVGDGTTDDTVAFQAAVVSAGATGRPLYVPPGTYLLDGTTIELASNLILFGAGKSSILKRTVTGSPLFKASASSNYTDIEFRDLQFLGPSSNAATTTATAILLNSTGTTGLRVHGCLFKRWTYGLNAAKVNPDLTFTECTGEGNSITLIRTECGVGQIVRGCRVNGDRTGVGDAVKTQVGIWISDAGDGSNAGYSNEVRDCIVTGCKNEGVIVRTALSSVIGCHVSSCTDGASGTYGIVVEDTSGTGSIGEFGLGAGNYVSVVGCTVYACDGGIRASLDPANVNGTPRDVLIANNQIVSCTGTSTKGIAVGFSNSKQPLRVVVTGNKVYNQSGATNADGIFLYCVKGGLVSGNQVYGATRAGIVLDTAGSAVKETVGVHVAGNHLVNCTSYGIYLIGRLATAIFKCVISSNTVEWLDTAAGASGIFCDSGTTGGCEEVAFLNNVIQGDSSTNGYGLRVNGTNLVAANNVAVGVVYRRVIETNGTTTWAETASLNDFNGRKITVANAAPSSTGTQDNQRDICWHKTPATGSPVGWICTASGTGGTSAGTWKAMPNLA